MFSSDLTEPARADRATLGLAAAAAVALSAVPLFVFRAVLPGLAMLALALLLGFARDRELGKDLLLVGLGLAIVSSTSVEANLEWGPFLRLGAVLSLAVVVPLAIDRLVFRRRAIEFPWRAGRRWTRLMKAYLVAVPALAWTLLPFYFIRSGAYLNWPGVKDDGELVRFLVGVNAVGTWDELFFICMCLGLLLRHFPLWQANLLQAIIFVSFLWELGYREWGPFLTAPFALLQGFLFARTHSLLYVLIVHLLFDVVVFLAIVHAHVPSMFAYFVY